MATSSTCSSQVVCDGSMRNDGCSATIGISVNVFYKTTDLKCFYSPKDPWCNADYKPYAQAVHVIEQIVSQLEPMTCVGLLMRLIDRVRQEMSNASKLLVEEVLDSCPRADLTEPCCSSVWKPTMKAIRGLKEMPARVRDF